MHYMNVLYPHFKQLGSHPSHIGLRALDVSAGRTFVWPSSHLNDGCGAVGSVVVAGWTGETTAEDWGFLNGER